MQCRIALNGEAADGSSCPSKTNRGERGGPYTINTLISPFTAIRNHSSDLPTMPLEFKTCGGLPTNFSACLFHEI